MENKTFLPYGRQDVDESDIKAVVDVLRSSWLTTGPAVEKFENAVADYVGSRYAVAVSSGTAALHAAIFALGLGPGDEVILPPLTFVATANVVLYQGATPVFADIENEGLLLDPQSVSARITTKTKAVIAVDYAGQPCNYKGLRELCHRHDLALVADACHSLGATYDGRPVGQLADLTAFSFHPVKPLTTGEGGMILTADAGFSERMRCFRNHGISSDYRQRRQQGVWQYAMVELGCNYRITDLQCALGYSQLQRLNAWIERRRELAEIYRQQLAAIPQVSLLRQFECARSGWHLLVIRVPQESRESLFVYLREQGIGVNVHYGLVYRHPYYQQRFNLPAGHCPVAEQATAQVLSLPLFPAMRAADISRVVTALRYYFESEH